MIELSVDFGSTKQIAGFTNYRGAIENLIGLITSIELYKAVGVSPIVAHDSSPVLDLARQLWKTYASKKDKILNLAEQWKPFGLIFQDIIEEMMGPESKKEAQNQSYFSLFEIYQQQMHNRDCCKMN
jgi:hypothetical protein